MPHDKWKVQFAWKIIKIYIFYYRIVNHLNLNLFFFSFLLIKQHSNNNNNNSNNNTMVDYKEVKDATKLIDFLESSRKRSQLDLILNTNTSKYINGFYAILPTWKKFNYLLKYIYINMEYYRYTSYANLDQTNYKIRKFNKDKKKEASSLRNDYKQIPMGKIFKFKNLFK
ncbi:unnamed protein product [Cunninghamella blakesleeana]